MDKYDDELTIRRILVALDGSHHSLAALKAAVELASSLEAVLQGLFVEDINLLRVAGLPGALEIRYPFTSTGRLDRTRMERQLRAQAERARRALAAACEREQIQWSFRVARGDVAAEVLEAALEADLLSLGKASRPIIQRERTGSTARAVATQAPRSVLLLSRDADIRPPVVALYDGSPIAQQALLMAAHLARKQGGYLFILILANTLKAAEQLHTQISDWLREPELLIHYRPLIGDGVEALIEEVQRERSGVLVLGDTILQSDDLQTLLDEVNCPTLVVR
jgi:nucleotide-binding universal stress UspA family protein